MKKLLPKVLFYYCAIAAFFITISTIFTSQGLAPVIFAILFLPIAAYFVIEFFKQVRGEAEPLNNPRKGEIISILIIFIILFGLGLKNIYTKTSKPEAIPSPLVFKLNSTPSPTPIPKLQIKITDGSPSINIREKPTIYSKKISEAKDGEVFEYAKKTGEWYEIRLGNKTLGYVAEKYVKIINLL